MNDTGCWLSEVCTISKKWATTTRQTPSIRVRGYHSWVRRTWTGDKHIQEQHSITDYFPTKGEEDHEDVPKQPWCQQKSGEIGEEMRFVFDLADNSPCANTMFILFITMFFYWISWTSMWKCIYVRYIQYKRSLILFDIYICKYNVHPLICMYIYMQI